MTEKQDGQELLAEKLYDKGYRIIEEGLCGRTSVFDDATRDGRNGAKVLPMLLETHAPLDQVFMLGTMTAKHITMQVQIASEKESKN